MNTQVTQLRGGKETGLFELKKHSQRIGYSVPKFFVLSDIENEEELAKLANHFKGENVIIRSNSVMENGNLGFDGIYKTVVVKNGNFEKIKEACQQVSESLFSEDAIAYRKKAGIAEDSMRIIMQKFIGQQEVPGTLHYIVMETSINAQGDISVVKSGVHDFINVGVDYEEVIMGRDGEILTNTNPFNAFSKFNLPKKLQMIAMELQAIFGPVSLEGAYAMDEETRDVKVFLFQRRLLAKEFYQAQPEVVPDTYKDEDILFRSNSYRGAGKIENLPIVVMPGIENINVWENDLRGKISQLKSDVILFVPTMELGVIRSRILNDYTALTGVKAIVSLEGIDFASHVFKVASLARIPFISVESFPFLERLSRGSLFFTENQAVLCADEKREEPEKFRFDRLKKSKAVSLAKVVKKKGVAVEFSEDEHKLGFQFNPEKFSFKDLEVSFHRLLEDVSGEVWRVTHNSVSLGFWCKNSEGHIIEFSGWSNYLKKEGYLGLDNFKENFENNQIEWNLIQKIFTQLEEGVPSKGLFKQITDVLGWR